MRFEGRAHLAPRLGFVDGAVVVRRGFLGRCRAGARRQPQCAEREPPARPPIRPSLLRHAASSNACPVRDVPGGPGIHSAAFGDPPPRACGCRMFIPGAWE
ncbi:hypothetical protein A176_005922 [Myxococcus hansupus]|uniref:Uncharacterized protein n=1 Tax=Pseudomyxococcus hansupus TaxID=1297742 RepID=A0A0H4X615_9BACT|nr:hypothetical protein A176_005922 [Myxococcus hansupus]